MSTSKAADAGLPAPVSKDRPLGLQWLNSVYAHPRAFTWAWIGCGVGITGIALLDHVLAPNVPLGILYLLPIVFAAPVLSRWQMVLTAVACALLREGLGPFAGEAGMPYRVASSFIGFEAVGFAMSELHRSRLVISRHLAEKDTEIALRRAAETELHAIIETSPLAVLTLDESGHILQANESAHHLLGVNSGGLAGQAFPSYVPVPLQLEGRKLALRVRARLECRARRSNGEPFLAHVWLGPYEAAGTRRMAVIVWDGSDDLRDREDVGFKSLMATSRIMLGAVCHEIRNFVSAARNSFVSLAQHPGVAGSPDCERLGRVLAGLESAANSGLRLASDRSAGSADLATVLDETWIIMEPGFRDAGIDVRWMLADNLPRVRGDQPALVQVLINLLRNSAQVLEYADPKRVTISTSVEADRVTVRIEDTGPGIAHPEELFHVFPTGAQTGLGLYISRSIVLSLGGDLRYEPQAEGACFVLELRTASSGEA